MLRKTSAAVAVVSLATVGAALFSGSALAGGYGKGGHGGDDQVNVVEVVNTNSNTNTNTNSATATASILDALL